MEELKDNEGLDKLYEVINNKNIDNKIETKELNKLKICYRKSSFA